MRSQRAVMLATGLAAALPILVSVVRALVGDWTLEGDQAIAATRAYDVFTYESPLVGPWSTTSNFLGRDAFHPGPLLYWLLAVPTRVPGVGTYPVVMGAVNVAAVLGVVALAHRRGGRALMFATAAALALMCASLSTEVLREVWNPSAPVVPFALLIFLCWSLACGDLELLPLTVLVASFAMQCHLIFLLPSVLLVGAGLAGLVLSRRHVADKRSVRRWTVAAVVVGLLAWSGPLLDQALYWGGFDRGHGNLATLADAVGSREEPVGAKPGLYAVVRAVGAPPWWLRAPQTDAVRAFDIFSRPGPLSFASTGVVLLGLAACALLAARRRSWDIVSACVLALLLCVALGVSTASYPRSSIFGYAYATRWASPMGMWTWLCLGWSAVTLWSPTRVMRRAQTPAMTAVALSAVVAIAVVVAASQGPDSQERLYKPVAAVVASVESALPNPRAVRLDGADLQFGSAVTLALRRRGAAVGVGFDEQFGRRYHVSVHTYDHVLDFRQGATPPADGRRIARVHVRGQRVKTLSVFLRRPTAGEP
jgi:hypothetical protein